MDTVYKLARKSANIYQRVSAFIILTGAFVCLVYFLGYFALNSGFTNQAFDVLVNSSIRGQVAWKRVAWGPWPSRIKILEPVLSDSMGRTVVSAKSITIDELDLVGLLNNRLSARSIRIDTPVTKLISLPNPESHASQSDEQVLNISEMFWPPGGRIDDGHPSQLDLDLTEIDIRNGMFVLDNPSTSIVAHGINIPNARFRLYETKADDFMAIESKHLSISQLQVKVTRKTATTTARKAKAEDVYSWPLRHLKIEEFNWNGDNFSFSHLQSLLNNDPLMVKAFKMELDRPDLPYLEADVKLETDQASKHIRNYTDVPIEGHVELSARVHGEVDVLEGFATLKSRELMVFGIKLLDVDSAIELSDEERLSIKRLVADTASGQVSADGQLDLEHGSSAINLFVEGVELRQLSPAVSAELDKIIGGRLNGYVLVTGQEMFSDVPNYAIRTDIATTSAKPRDAYGLAQHLDINAFTTFRDSTLDFSELDITSGSARLLAKGKFALDTFVIDMKGRVRAGQIKPIASAFGVPARGRGQASFSIRGYAKSPRFEAGFQLSDLVYDDLSPAALSGKVAFADGRLDLDQVSLKSDFGSVAAKGRINIAAPNQPLDFRLNARRLELSAIPFTKDFSGRSAVDIRLRGPSRRPRITGRARIARPCWKTPHGDRPLCFRRVEVVGDWSGDRVTLDTLKLNDRKNTLIDMKGRGDIKRLDFNGSVKLNGLPVALVNHFVKEPLPASGTLQADFTIAGNLKRPAGDGRLNIKQARFGEYELGDVKVEVQADRSEVKVSGELLNAIKVRGTMPLVRDGRNASGVIEFAGLQVEKHLPAIKTQPLDSRATGRVEFELNPTNFKLRSARAKLEQLQAKYSLRPDLTYVSELSEPVLARWDGKLINIEQLNLRIRRLGVEAGDANGERVHSFVRLAGTVSAAGELELDTRSRLDLSLIEPFLESVLSEATGHLEIDGRIAGPSQAPQPQLEVQLKQAQFVPRLSMIGSQLDLVRPVTMRIAPDTTETGGRNASGGGNFVVSLADTTKSTNENNRFILLRNDAKIEIDKVLVQTRSYGLERVKVRLKGNEIGLNVPRVIRGTFDTPGLTFESWIERFDERRDERRMKLSGQVEVIQGEYMSDLTGVNEINQDFRDRLSGRTQTRTVSLFERVPALKRLMLNLRVIGDGGFYVRNRVLTLSTNLEIRLNLEEITGFLYSMPNDTEDERLSIRGDVNILPDSTITYARREFDVSSGNVNFGGRNFLDAQIEANRTFTLRTGQSVSTASTSFDTGSGDIRLEEVVLSARLNIPTLDTPPNFAFDLTSNSGASKLEVITLVLTGSYPENLSGAASAQPATEVVLAPLLSLVEAPLEDTFQVDLTLTPVSTGTLYIDANKVLSRRLYLYSRVLVGDEQDGNPQQFGLRYQINNVAFGELSNERLGTNISTTGRLKLRVDLN